MDVDVTRKSFLVVDGNNIIHAWSDLLTLHRKRKGKAHSQLVRILESYQDFSDERVVLVFDGRGNRITEERNPDSVQVIYSSSGMTADAVIERLATANASRFDIVVATNDVAVQDAVAAAGGRVISAEGLRDLVESRDRDLQRWMRSR